jgi:hypothetical protein
MAGLEISPWLYLLAEIAAGAAGYIASALVVAGAQSQDLLHLVRSALRRPEPAVSGA